jgi:hypothetical protein
MIRSRTNSTFYVFGVTAGVTVLQTALVILASGYARPGREGQGADNTAKAADAATYQCVGVATETVTGGGANGDVTIKVEAAEFPFASGAGGDAITAADIGKLAYVIDDQTVGKTNPNSIRAAAGRITGVDGDGTVWVRVGPGLAA